jgi:hypothetical protein
MDRAGPPERGNHPSWPGGFPPGARRGPPLLGFALAALEPVT